MGRGLMARVSFKEAAAAFRTVLFYGLFGGFVIVVLLLCWPLAWLGPAFSSWLFRQLTKVLMGTLRVLVGIRVRFEGVEKLEQAKKEFGCFLLAPKHQSALETLVFSLFFHRFWIIYKQELNKVPVVSRYMKSMQYIAIDRSSGRRAVQQLFDRGKEAVKKKVPILIFPEGTRTLLGQRGHYHAGVALMCSQLNIPILPVAHNAGKSFRKHCFALLPGTITFCFLDPILPGPPVAKLLEQVEDRIENACPTLP